MNMDKIKGRGNKIVLHFPQNREIECVDSNSAIWHDAVNRANIVIDGENNQVNLHFNSEEEAVNLLANIAFNILIVGNGNQINVGKSLTVGYTPGWGMFGLHLVIGTGFDHWTNTPRTANNCHIDIDEHIIACGAMIYLQEEGSHITIGRDTMISWGVDIWNTDAHTIMDMDGHPTNHPGFIEIGERVWIGKDVKIGKNVRIDSDNIIGWGSILTKSIEGHNQLAVGSPARVVKTNVRWDGRSINEYMRETERRRNS